MYPRLSLRLRSSPSTHRTTQHTHHTQHKENNILNKVVKPSQIEGYTPPTAKHSKQNLFIMTINNECKRLIYSKLYR